jgi:hypothetical protein
MQSRSIYLYAKSPKSGMRIVALGLMETDEELQIARQSLQILL